MAVKKIHRGKMGRPKKAFFPIPDYVTKLPPGEQEIYWQFIAAYKREAELSLVDEFHLHLAAIEYIMTLRDHQRALLEGKSGGKETAHFSNLYKSLEHCSLSRKDRSRQRDTLDTDLKQLAGL